MQRLSLFDIAADGLASKAELDQALPKSGYRWISGSPEDERLAVWCQRNLPEFVTQALFQAETRPRALTHDSALVLILRGVNLNPEAEVDDMVSVRTYTRPGLIITLRHRPVFALRAMQDKVEAQDGPRSAEHFLQILCDELVTQLETVSLALEDQVDLLEEQEFGALGETAQLPDLAQLRRRSIRLRRYSAPLSTALHDASRIISHNPEAGALLAESANLATRAVEEIEAARDRLTALADHIDMKNALRQQNNGYLLTVVAAIFLPLGFLTGLFGVNVAGMPGIDWPLAFWVLTGFSFLCGVVVAVILRFLRWF